MRIPFTVSAPHRLLALFLVATIVPSAALVWLGSQLLEQDRGLERQRIHDMLETTASRVSAGIERELGSIERDLTMLVSNQSPNTALDAVSAKALAGSDSALAVRLTQAGVVAHTGAPVVYRPSRGTSAPEPADAVWADAERLEFAHKDADGAVRAYRAIATSSDANTRAGGLMRLARVQKAAGRHDQALGTYATLATLTTATINGDPADLMARWARVRLLRELGRQQVSQTEATALALDLQSDRWAIDRTTYLVYTRELASWVKAPPVPPVVARTALTESVAWAWEDWRTRSTPRRPGSGRRALRVGTTPVLLVWREEGDELLLFAATSAYLNDKWGHLWAEEDIAVALVDDDGQTVVGQVPSSTTIPPVVKPSSDTRLPWTLRIAATTPPVDITTTGSTRRQLLTAGLVLLLVLIPSTAYLVGRTVHRELAVARQQADFVSAVSHEFRSPLTSLTHLTSLLRSDFQPSDQRRRQDDDALARETDRLHRFVETLLDFGRMQAGATRYRLAPLDVVPCVSAVVDEFRNDATAGTHPVSFASPGQMATVDADPEALGRAIWNLLENAAKYSADGSPIAVRLDLDDRTVAIRVTDQGAGIPEEEQPHIFQQFYRGAAASLSAVKGTGVGLAVVQHIVRGHGGDVQLESRPGSGSTFSIVLPVVDRDVSDTARRAS